MDAWTISYVILWVIVLIEGAVLIVLLRTFGSFYLNTRSGVSRDGLALGTRAPGFTAPTARGTKLTLPANHGRWRALFSVSAACEECYAAMPGLAELQAELDEQMRVVMLLPVEADEVPDMPLLHNSPIEVAIVGHEGLRQQYRIRVMPFMRVVDPDGIVRAKGVVRNRERLEHLLDEAGMQHPLLSRHSDQHIPDEHHHEEAHAHG
jgi:hypothetical protein